MAIKLDSTHHAALAAPAQASSSIARRTQQHHQEEAEVSNCVSNLIQAFSNGLNVFKRLRERRRKKKAKKEREKEKAVVGEESDEVQLSKSLRKGPMELAQTYDACYSQTGQRFAKGDAIAHASLAETLIKLNTGLVAIIASFLNHDSKGSKNLDLNYKSLTNLSDASRKEALRSMTQLYQRLSESQLQLQVQQIGIKCEKCGSKKHASCSSAKEHKKSNSTGTTARSNRRIEGPTITRMPLKSSSSPQLVVVRPRPGRKSSSSSSSSKSSSPQHSTCTSPLSSPLPLYIAESPFEIETDGVIKGVLGDPPPSKDKSNTHTRRRKDSAVSYDKKQSDYIVDTRPQTWPEHYPDYAQHDNLGYGYGYPYGYPDAYITHEPMHLHLPAPKLPTFTPTPRTQKPSTYDKHAFTNTKKSPPPVHMHPALRPQPHHPSQLNSHELPATPVTRLHPAHTTSPTQAAITRRRLDKVTPSAYTFASDSTKLGEIPMRKWGVPWDQDRADRLNGIAAGGAGGEMEKVVGKGSGSDGGKKGGKDMEKGKDGGSGSGNGKEKGGMFRWMRKGNGGAGVST